MGFVFVPVSVVRLGWVNHLLWVVMVISNHLVVM